MPRWRSAGTGRVPRPLPLRTLSATDTRAKPGRLPDGDPCIAPSGVALSPHVIGSPEGT